MNRVEEGDPSVKRYLLTQSFFDPCIVVVNPRGFSNLIDFQYDLGCLVIEIGIPTRPQGPELVLDPRIIAMQ